MSVERIKRKSGAQVYRVRWREHGHNRARTFDRKADADAWDREVKRRQQLGVLAVQQLTDKGATLGCWIIERWTPEHGVTLEQTTRDRYASAHALHIAPVLDDVPLLEITVGVLRRWQAGLIADGMKPASVHKCRTFLSSVRLLAPLTADLKEWRMASGRPGANALVFPRGDGQPWTKDDWDVFRGNGCKRAQLRPVPRPYDLRHSFASLLLAEGRSVHYVAAQLGHSPVLTLSTCGHLIAEYAELAQINAEHEIILARGERSAERSLRAVARDIG